MAISFIVSWHLAGLTLFLPACRSTKGHSFGGNEFPIRAAGTDIMAKVLEDNFKGDIAGVMVPFGDHFSFPFCGKSYTEAAVNIRGDIVLGENSSNGRTPPTQKAHCRLPRVSALLGFNQWEETKSSLRMLQLGDRIVFSYTNLPEKNLQGDASSETLYSSFQVTLYSNGQVQVAYKKVRPASSELCLTALWEKLPGAAA